MIHAEMRKYSFYNSLYRRNTDFHERGGEKQFLG